MANKAYVYAIYPNEKQNEQCQKTFGCCRFVYNQMLTIQQDRYKNGESHLSKISSNNYCSEPPHLNLATIGVASVSDIILSA